MGHSGDHPLGGPGGESSIMMITVDPSELIALSETLRTCAVEAAGIGSQLSACARCPMPADVQSAVDQLVVDADRALDSVATWLGAQAADLANRAQIASTDSLASALIDAGYAAPFATSTSDALAAALVNAGYGADHTVISGGDALFSNFGLGSTRTVDTWGDGAGLFEGFDFNSPDDTGAAAVLAGGGSIFDRVMTILPLDPNSINAGRMLTAVNSQAFNERAMHTINRVLNDPLATAADLRAVGNIHSNMIDSARHAISASPLELYAEAGHHLTEAELKELSPLTPNPPIRPLDA